MRTDGILGRNRLNGKQARVWRWPPQLLLVRGNHHCLPVVGALSKYGLVVDRSYVIGCTGPGVPELGTVTGQEPPGSRRPGAERELPTVTYGVREWRHCTALWST